MKKRIRCRFFSLVEIIVVVAILAISASAIGISVYRAIEGTRLQQSIEVIKDKFYSACELSLLARVPIRVCVKKDDNGYFIYLDCEMLPTKYGVKHWWAKPQRLSGIKEILIRRGDEEVHNQFDIVVNPTGIIWPEANLEITSRLNEGLITIPLAPYANSESKEDLAKQSNELYPEKGVDQKPS